MKTVSPEEKVYETWIDLANKNNSHTILCDFIIEACSKESARILEVGCATGFLGAFLKERGHEVWGVELSPHQAEIAAKRLDYIYVGGIEDFLKSGEVDGIFFDFIIFGDVLEHLRDPLEIIKSCGAILSPDGAVLASIPNVAHLAVRIMLLEGRWEYVPFGILDDSHLKFFTRKSIVELFSSAGYDIKSMCTVRVPIEKTEIEVNQVLLEKAKDLIVDDDQDVYQYVVMARKGPDLPSIENNTRFLGTRGSHILCLLPIEDWSVGYIRLINPLEKWRQLFGGVVKIKSYLACTSEDLSWADYVILQREGNLYTLELTAQIQKLGKPIIFDIDDLLTEVPPFLISHWYAEENKEYLKQILRMADGITVTTDLLREKMKVYNRNVFIVPNCASAFSLPAKHYKTENRSINLIVSSSDTVRVDFIVQALTCLQNDADLNIRLIGIGPPGKYLVDSGLDVTCRDNLAYDKFTKYLASIDNAIGIIPLDDLEFSACKSAIKYVDYSLAGIPVVCSNVSPYKDVIKNGETGILVENDEEAWVHAIRRLALSIEERRRLSEAAMVYCRSAFSLTRAARTWNEVFSRVCSGQGEILPDKDLKTQGEILPDSDLPPWLKRQSLRSILRHCLSLRSYLVLFRLALRQMISGLEKIANLMDVRL